MESDIRAKVDEYLVSKFGAEVRADGDFSVRQGSSHVFIRVSTNSRGQVLVTLTVPLLAHVPPSPELFEYVAVHFDDYSFGHLGVRLAGDHVNLVMAEHLLGDHLDEAELINAVASIGLAADELDDELQDTYGGFRYHELPE